MVPLAGGPEVTENGVTTIGGKTPSLTLVSMVTTGGPGHRDVFSGHGLGGLFQHSQFYDFPASGFAESFRLEKTTEINL